MANNPYVNKVVFGDTTVMDISDTTAVAADVASSAYFYTAAGQKVQGSMIDGDELGYGGRTTVGLAIVGAAILGERESMVGLGAIGLATIGG